MKDKYIVSIYVAECNEFRNEGECYEGIYDMPEAIEARNSLPTARVPVIGLRIHKKGQKELTDVLTDILIGEEIHLEALEYIPRILESEAAVNYIAELIVLCPDNRIQGMVPECLDARIKEYEKNYQDKENIFRIQLYKKLSQLTAEAMKYSKSTNQSERQYAAELLKYAVSQKEAILHGQKEIDLNSLPLKENYFTEEIPRQNIEKTDNVKTTEQSGANLPRVNSLLAKLYEYQKLLKEKSI
ncbi:MAG: hypothetical protein LUI12_10065 [Clostridiales bacterium]|nr:hypothetical protein [Clostridiales bacterium]